MRFDVVGMKGVAVDCRREPEIRAELAVDAARRQAAEEERAGIVCDLDPSAQTATSIGSAESRVRWSRDLARRFELFNFLWEGHAAAVHASARLMCGLARADEVTCFVFVDVWSQPGRLDVSDDTVRPR